MSNLINLAARLHAYETGRAVRSAARLQVAIQPHALIVCPLAMAGEDTAVHALAVGRIGGPPEIHVIPDPRVRERQYQLIERFGRIIEDYYAERRQRGEFPQVWVSSGAAASHLDILADRLRFTRDAPTIKRAGELLTYVTERRPVAGQQALLTATGVLGLHYSTGQQEGEDEHLGAFLTWLAPPAEQHILEAVARAERVVMGVKTDPEFDAVHLQPMLSSYHAAKSGGASEAELAEREERIRERLSPIVENIYNGVQQALRHLQGRFAPAGALSELVVREAQEFENFMQNRDAERPLPYRDRPKSAAFKITQREISIQDVEKGAIYGDEMAQARARLEGKILSGRVENLSQRKTGPRKVEHRFDILTLQSNLHLRIRDDLASLADSRLQCVVERVQREGNATRVTLLMTAGMKAVGIPDVGSEMEFSGAPPDWSLLIRTRTKMSTRLEQTPWTHGDAAPGRQPDSPVERPADLLAAIEALK